MRKIKCLTFIVMALFLFTTVYATDLSNSTEGITVVEVEQDETIDNSHLLVEVVKFVNEEKQVIYQGPLGSYEGGWLSSMDFSDIDFAVIFDWEHPEESGVYIKPMQINSTPNVPLVYMNSNRGAFFRLEDAVESIDTSGTRVKKIYDIDLLDAEYVDYMNNLSGANNGSDSGMGDMAPNMSYDYNISAINLRDDEDNSVDCLVEGGVLQSVTVESNGASDDVILAVAEYNGYTITKLTSYEIELQNDRDVVMTNYALPTITDDTSIRLFVWDAYWGINPMAEPISIFNENTFDISLNFLYDNMYTEKELVQGQTVTAELYVRSKQWWSKDVCLYLALYDSSDALINVVKYDDRIASDGIYHSVTAGIPISQDLPTGYKIKSFVWDTKTMKPYFEREIIVGTEDYHSEDIVNSRYIDMEKALSGRIDSETDIDCVKFIPASLNSYMIQVSGNVDVSLYDSQGVLISADETTLNGIGTLIESDLLKGKEYYLTVSGEEQTEYTIRISENEKGSDEITLSDNRIYINGTIEPMETYTAKLFSSSGEMIDSKEFVSNDSGEYSLDLGTGLQSGEYNVVILKDNRICKKWFIQAALNECAFDVSEGGFCSVPVVISNGTVSEDIKFSVSYSSDDFEVYDACELVDAKEDDVNILENTPSCIIFKTATEQNESGNEIVNIVKLCAKKAGVLPVSVCAYKVE